MNFGFSHNASFCVNGTVSGDISDRLLDAIKNHSDWTYTCIQTPDGYFLKPGPSRSRPYRNGFLPEIHVTLSQSAEQTQFHLHGKLEKPIRILNRIWFGFALFFELTLLIGAFNSSLTNNFALLYPLILAVYNYLVTKLASLSSFRSIVEAIHKDFP